MSSRSKAVFHGATVHTLSWLGEGARPPPEVPGPTPVASLGRLGVEHDQPRPPSPIRLWRKLKNRVLVKQQYANNVWNNFHRSSSRTNLFSKDTKKAASVDDVILVPVNPAVAARKIVGVTEPDIVDDKGLAVVSTPAATVPPAVLVAEPKDVDAASSTTAETEVEEEDTPPARGFFTRRSAPEPRAKKPRSTGAAVPQKPGGGGGAGECVWVMCTLGWVLLLLAGTITALVLLGIIKWIPDGYLTVITPAPLTSQAPSPDIVTTTSGVPVDQGTTTRLVDIDTTTATVTTDSDQDEQTDRALSLR